MLDALLCNYKRVGRAIIKWIMDGSSIVCLFVFFVYYLGYCGIVALPCKYDGCGIEVCPGDYIFSFLCSVKKKRCSVPR